MKLFSFQTIKGCQSIGFAFSIFTNIIVPLIQTNKIAPKNKILFIADAPH